MDTILKRILYVEDEEDLQLLVQIALKDIGKFTVKVCSSGKEAIATAEAFKPDLFLLDIMMPELDGPATLNELHKLPSIKNIPAIFLTAVTQGTELIEYKKSGVIAVIFKPFDVITLADTIRQHWSVYHG